MKSTAAMPDGTPDRGSLAVERGHEASEFNAGYLGWFGIGIAVLVIVTACVAFELLGGFRVPQPPAAQGPQSDVPSVGAPPALQSAPQGELRVYRRDKAAALEGYHWVDRAGGIVQIPIERAMELTAERAQPAAAAPEQPERTR
jgi:hypothetical protein